MTMFDLSRIIPKEEIDKFKKLRAREESAHVEHDELTQKSNGKIKDGETDGKGSINE